MTEYSQKIRVNRIQEPKVRVRVKPRVPPLEIELQNTGAEIQWRLGTTGAWVDLIAIDDIDASVTIGTVTTLAPGAPATVTNVGTAQNMILDFGLPAGFDGQVVDVTGTGLTINSADPAHPVLTVTATTVPFTPTGGVAAATVQAAIVELDSGKLAISNARIRLTANSTYYVNPSTGNDTTGDGSSGAPWATLQRAVDWCCGNLDLGTFDCTISCANSSSYAPVNLTKYISSGGVMRVTGNVATPANCKLISSASGVNGITGDLYAGEWYLSGFETQIGVGNASHVLALLGSYLDIDNWRYVQHANAVASFALNLVRGGYIKALTSTTTASAGCWGRVDNNGGGSLDLVGGTKTISGSPAYSVAGVYTIAGYVIGYSHGFTGGTPTGTRYKADNGGVIDSSGQGSTFPGNAIVAPTTGYYS